MELKALDHSWRSATMVRAADIRVGQLSLEVLFRLAGSFA